MMDRSPIARLQASLPEESATIKPKNVYSIDQILGNSTREHSEIRDGE